MTTASAATMRRRLLDSELRALRPMAVLRILLKQPAAYLALCGYFMVEYVRPQNVYPAIDFLPWGLGVLVLAFGLYVLKPSDGPRALTSIDYSLIFFSLILVCSTATSTYRSWSIAGLEFYINWLLIYVLVAGLVKSPRQFLIFTALFLLWSLKMSQHGARTFAGRGFSFAHWGATGGPGWFHNSGEFAIQMCVFLPMAYYFFVGLRRDMPPWLFWAGLAATLGTALISLVASSSRGGQLAAGVVFLFMIGQSRSRVKGLVGAVVMIGAIWFLTPPEQKARFAEMGEDGTSQSRLTYWRDGLEIINDYPVLGIGYDAWEPFYRRHYNPVGELPHNIFVEAGTELGYPGLLGFLAMIGATFAVNARTRRISRHSGDWGHFLRCSAFGLDAALVGFLASGFFVTVLYYPYFWVNLAFTAALYETTRREVRRSRSQAQATEPIRPVPVYGRAREVMRA